jgi:hypothetical protein
MTCVMPGKAGKPEPEAGPACPPKLLNLYLIRLLCSVSCYS